MGNQTKLVSLIEVWTNIFIGYWIALLIQLIVFPMYGMEVSFGDNIGIGLIFTAAALVRGYIVRRFFNGHIHRMSTKMAARIDS